MSESGQYLTALEIAKTISEACNNQVEARLVFELVGELIKLRWSISPPQS